MIKQVQSVWSACRPLSYRTKPELSIAKPDANFHDPPIVINNANQGSSIRTRVVFAENEDVAFRPKPTSAIATPTTDWYLGKVTRVIGEGKTRHYKVKDEDPDVPELLRKSSR